MDQVKVNIGCGRNISPDHINVDIEAYPGVDIVANLDERWPFEDSSVDEFHADNIIEHLVSPIHTMNEVWRCLKMGGRLDFEVPSTNGMGAFQDPTHKSFWNPNSFLYYTDDGFKHYCSAIKCNFIVKEIVTVLKRAGFAEIPFVRGVLIKQEVKDGNKLGSSSEQNSTYGEKSS